MPYLSTVLISVLALEDLEELKDYERAMLRAIFSLSC